MVDTQEIITKFYILHEKPSVIAKELNVNTSYVTKVIQKDDRYIPQKNIELKSVKKIVRNLNVNGLERKDTMTNNLMNM